MKPFREKENIYTRTKLEQAIDDLTELGLYPLSFEAPHYTMSEEGYKIASSYFSSIFGQVQLSGTTWKTWRPSVRLKAGYAGRDDAVPGNNRLCR